MRHGAIALRARFSVAVLLALALCAVSGIGLGAGKPGIPVARAATSLPECRYDDVLTRYERRRDWHKTLVDTIYAIPKSYTPPPRLVSSRRGGLNDGELVRRFVIRDLAALAAAARRNGTPLRVISGYRTFRQQQYLYNREVRNFGLELGRMRVARPGHSEHHLGTGIDFGSADDRTPGWKYDDWATSPAGAFLAANAWRYGFVMSYPRGRESITCYMYEPWHYRYVGREMAADLMASGLTLREYLWQAFHEDAL